MSMKLTRRRGGHYMATLYIGYHANKRTAVHALVAYRAAELFDKDSVTASRALVERALRNCYRNNGESAELVISEMVDDLDDGAELVAWATAEIERLFPEWRA